MLSYQIVAWRYFVYNHNLHAIVGNDSIVFRDCSPIALRRDPSALHRIMDFANRDLSLLVCGKKQLLEVFDALQSLVQAIDMRSDEFLDEAKKQLGAAANQFVHELISFAQSPYDSLISYDCNMKYRARNLDKFEVDDCGLGVDFQLLPGVFSFPEYVKSIQEDENFDEFAVDVDVEDEDVDVDVEDEDVLDNYMDMSAVRASLFEEIRRVLTSRRQNASRQFAMSSPARSPVSSPAEAEPAALITNAAGNGRSNPVPFTPEPVSPQIRIVPGAPAVSSNTERVRHAQPTIFHRSPIQLRSRTAGVKRRSQT